MSAPDAELRELVRSLVVAALQRVQGLAASAPPSALPHPASPSVTPPASTRRILLLFMSNEAVPDEFFPQIGSLVSHGYGFVAAVSRSFEENRSPGDLDSRLPSGIPLLTSSTREPEQLKAVSECVAVIAHSVSANTAAKVAQGIDDALPSRIVRAALLAGKPVFIARDLPQFERTLAELNPAAPPPLIRTTVDTIHRLQNLGARFVATADLTAGVVAAFHQPVNETPARLAKSIPSRKRVFITAEDVWTAASTGRRELLHPADAIVTDAAREEAAARGLTLVSGA